MKINIQIICKDEDEFDVGKGVICAFIEDARKDDVINANIVICSKDEGNAYAEE